MRQTVASFLDDYARRGADETAFAHRRGLRVARWSYRRVAETAHAFARELEARCVTKGERVLLWGENSPEWAAAFYGCALLGAVVVPLDVESAPDFVERVRQQTQAKLLLKSAGVGESKERFTGAKGSGGHAAEASLASLPFINLEDLSEVAARRSVAPYVNAEVKADDLLEIIYTSGTTAEPRGVCLTHRNVLANLAPLEAEVKKYARWERLTVHPTRFLCLLPLSHVFGQFMGIFVPQLLGGEVHFLDTLNPSEVARTVRAQRVSVVVAVPRLLETLREHVERVYAARGEGDDFRRNVGRARGGHFLHKWWTFRRAHREFGWKFWAFISGGATLPEETEKFWQRLGFLVIQGYGMTETASLVSVNHPFKNVRGSVGQALPGREVKLSENGEILVRGAGVSPGYWRDGLKPLTDSDGWLHTGDVGELDEAGNIKFKGRLKDVIVTAAGLNIHPEDLEAALDAQPEVRASAVVGVEGARGPEPLAVLILRDSQADAAQIVERANQLLARHQEIRRWHVWPGQDFPRTPTHKVRKRDVLERIAREETKQDGAAGSKEIAPPVSPAGHGDELRRVLASLGAASSGAGANAMLSPSASLASDLKLDSLGRVELLSALEERFQVEIDEATFTAATTVSDIERIVSAGGATTERAADESSRDTARHPYPEWARTLPFTWLRVALLYLIAMPITALLCWLRVRGKEKLSGVGEGPALFVANHITYFDHALILSALPGRFRRRLAVAQEGERLRRWRYSPPGTSFFTRWRRLAQYYLVVAFFNTFPLPQKSGFRRSFAYAGEFADMNYSVLVFPEGTRTEHGELHPFMRGTGLLAAQLQIPVVPVRIKGLSELKRRGRRGFAWPGTVSVTFGDPVRFDAGADPEQITRELQERVATL